MKYLPTLLAESISQGYSIKPLNNETYLWDYPLVYDDGSKRLQFVYISEITNNTKEYLYIRSRIADFDDRLNAMQLLREADNGTLSSIRLKPQTKEDGTQSEGVYVQVVLPAALILQNKGFFSEAIHEVANRADALEKKYLGDDKL
ncbi:MAG: hypothetical protein ACTHMV_11150 [Chitinophagaceae bacterium]